MQNKLCSKCNQLLPATAFHVRRASHDGLAPNCAACKNNQHRIDYWGMPEQGAKQRARSIVNRQARFAADPAYKRAFHLWGTTKKRTVIPPWVSIVDFVPVCRAVLLAGDGYELDHVIPLKVSWCPGCMCRATWSWCSRRQTRLSRTISPSTNNLTSKLESRPCPRQKPNPALLPPRSKNMVASAEWMSFGPGAKAHQGSPRPWRSAPTSR